jgi:hypothetical protein
MLELLNRARAGDADAAAALWRAIDAGQVGDDIAAAWARDVAAQVVSKVLNPEINANRRAEKARAALGLEGRLDPNLDLAELARALPHATASEIANVADLLVDVGKAEPRQVRRKVEYIRRKNQN